MILTPSYEDIFDGPKPKLEDILKRTSTAILIELIAYIDAQLYPNATWNKQVNILKHYLSRQPVNLRNKIFAKFDLFKFKNGNNDISLFSRIYLKYFLHAVLLNDNNLIADDTSPTQELDFFKAYLLIQSEQNILATKRYKIERQSSNGDFFPIHTWPILINQFDIQIIVNPIYNLIKGVCFLNYLQFHSNYSKYVISFLNKNNKPNSWEYLMTIFGLLQKTLKNNKANCNNYFFTCSKELQLLFNHLTLTVDEYKRKVSSNKENFSLFKAKPLMKHGERYIVLDWNLLMNKIYDGLIFDFYNTSGIKTNQDFDTLPKFKKFIGNEITEKFLFQRLLNKILDKKHCKLNLPEYDDQGEPDGYFRKNSSIVLFEIKNAFFPASAIESCTYQDIKNTIDLKYNNKKKGIAQIIKQIQKLSQSPFYFDEYRGKIKTKNLQIYPVMIYTDKHFGMPGVSNYLNNEFNLKLDSLNLRQNFKKIQNLTFIDFDLFIRFHKYLNTHGFIQTINSLHSELKKRKRNSSRGKQIQDFLDFNESQDQIFQDLNLMKREKEHNLKELINLLELTEGLPKN